MEKRVGTTLYRNILREYGRVNQPKFIRDAAVKRKVLQMLESATRGFDRLDDVTKRLDPKHGYGAVGEAPGSAARLRSRTSTPCNTLSLGLKNSLAPINTTQHNHCLSTSPNNPTFIAQDSHLSKGMSDGRSTS